MVDSREKGARAETVIKKHLKELTNLAWERTPGSGALHEKHQLKGDLYVVGEKNLWCVECKHYADDHLTSKVLTDKIPQLIDWWDQCTRQANQVNRKPLLIFKFDRSKIFCAFDELPNTDLYYLYVNRGNANFFVSLLEHWVQKEKPKFIA